MTTRRNLLLLPLTIALALGMATLIGAIAPVTADGAASNSYVVTKTFGPYNGAAAVGTPSSVPDGRALAVYCGDRESVLGGTAKVNRRTSYGTASSTVLTLDVIGAFYDPERGDFALGWGAFTNPTGRKGWNSVTISVTCRR